MANWQDDIYKNYISGKMSEQGRSNYEADLIAGVIQAPLGSQKMIADAGSDVLQQPAQPQAPIPIEGVFPAHMEETKPAEVPDVVMKRFWDGQMSDEGMKNLIADLRSGSVITAESEDVSFFEGVKEGITGAGRRVPETEALPSWVRMPEMNNLSLRGAKSLVGTMAAGPDEISQVIKKQNPDVDIAKDSKGNYVFTSGMDGNQYAIKPGFRTEEDLLRSATTMLLFAAGARGTGLQRVGGAGATQFGIEATQEMAGGKFDAMEIPLAMTFEGGGVAAGKGIAALRGFFKGKSAPEPIRRALAKAGIKTRGPVPIKTEQLIDLEKLSGKDFVDASLKNVKTRRGITDKFIKGNPDAPFKAKTNSGIELFVHKSAKEPGRWQLSIIGEDGIPSGDSQFSTYKEAVDRVTREWKVLPDKFQVAGGAKANTVPIIKTTPIKTELEKTVETAKRFDIEPLTSDVFPPKTPTQKAVQIGTERMPIIGTGGKRVEQQEARVEAIRGVLREYGATETAQASDDVMKDLLKKRGADIQKYNKQKVDVIERLSEDSEKVFHGTSKDFNVFESKEMLPGKLGTGTYFGKTKGKAKVYGDKIKEAYLDEGNVLDWDNLTKADRKKIVERFNKTIPDTDRPGFASQSKTFKQSEKDEALKFFNKKKEETKGLRHDRAKAKVDADENGNFVIAWGVDDLSKASDKDLSFIAETLDPDAAWDMGYDTVKRGKEVLVRNTDQISTTPIRNTVPINKTTAAIDKEITRLTALDNKDVEPLIDALENSRTSFTEKTLAQVEDNRKVFGEKLGSENFAAMKSQADKVNKKIYKAVNEDMGEFIKTNGKRRDYDKWKTANQRLSKNIRELDISALKASIKNGKSSPEEVRKLLFSRRPSDINRLYKSLSPQGKARARVAMWQEAMAKAGGIDELSTAKFQTALKNMEKSTGVFFKGEDKKVLDGLVKALKSTRRAEIASVSPPTGMQNYQNIAALGLGGGAVAGGAKFVVPALTIGAAARAYESKAVRNLLIKIAKGKGNEQKYISQLVNVLRTKHQLQRKDSAADKRKALELINRKT